MQGWFWRKCRILTFLFIWTTLFQKVKNDSNNDCRYGSFWNGDSCKDCPVGYTGDNCSDVCPPHTYGKLCGQPCKCTSCHHIFGCMTTEASTIGHMNSETIVSHDVVNITNQTILETTQSTSKRMTSGSSVSLAIDNTTRQKIRNVFYSG
nr:uncharacterized protein LOC105331273 [Crassostrea gigas]